MIGPNPFDEILIVELSEGQNFPVDLIATNPATDQVFRDRIFTSKKIVDTSNFPPGLYQYVLKHDDKILEEGYLKKVA
ncbi:MAG: hypothetical protein ACK50N_01035 [Flavobacteriales bacterium]|jgi:hypothetical protein